LVRVGVRILVFLTVGLFTLPFAQQLAVPFEICAQSDTWIRPSAEMQARIWTDPRYRDLGPRAYQWTHNFIWNEPDSASLTYESDNLSGLWTEAKQSQCPRRDTDRAAWTEIWVLNYRVIGITLEDTTYTVSVVREERGYQMIQFRRADSLGARSASLKVVDENGSMLEEWSEVRPSVFTSVR